MTERFAPDFRTCLLASVGLHAALFGLRFLRLPSFSSEAPVEIDLTSPFIGNGPAKLAAPKRLIPQAKLPAAPVPEPLPPTPPKPQPAPQQWTLPSPQTKTVAPPKPEAPPPTQGGAVNGAGISPIQGGSGPGFPYGVPNGSMTPGAPADIVRPKLLNLDDVLANLRKYYPERERYLGHEGNVVIDIHLGADGSIAGVDIVQSAGPLFDAAAVKVAHLMKFSPARTAAGPVASKVEKKLEFRLED